MDDNTIILLCLGVIVFSIVFIFYVKWKRNKDVDKWLVENKYARKVYLDSSIGIKSLVVQVQKVNGEKPKIKTIKGKNILYLLPGINTISILCSYTRPDVLRKSVTSIYGPIDIDINIEHYVDYKISFDLDNNKFIINKISEYI